MDTKPEIHMQYGIQVDCRVLPESNRGERRWEIFFRQLDTGIERVIYRSTTTYSTIKEAQKNASQAIRCFVAINDAFASGNDPWQGTAGARLH